MHSTAEPSGTTEKNTETAGEPVAIVGIAALHPEAGNLTDFWRLLTGGPHDANVADDADDADDSAAEDGAGPADGRDGQGRPDTVGGTGGADSEVPGPGLDGVRIDVARFRIPPAQAGAMARLQLLMLEAARRCLEDAGGADRALDRDRTDVVVGTCFGLDRQYANALRVEGRRYARELRRAAAGSSDPRTRENAAQAEEELRSVLRRRLGASPHDRVGEMASTIPARIASAFRLRGRTLALESSDATSFVALAHALTALRAGACDAVLVVTGQRRESPLLERALAAKGLEHGLGEGVGALLLKRLGTAERDGDRIHALVRGCSLTHEARPGPFGRSTSAVRHRANLRQALREAGRGAPVQYVEHATPPPAWSLPGGGTAGPARGELSADSPDGSPDETGPDPLIGPLPAAPSAEGAPAQPGSACPHAAEPGAGPGPVPFVRRTADRLGHTLANAGVAAVSTVALALRHRTVPAASPDAGAVPWPAPEGGAPRRAVVAGSSLTGTVCHVVLEEYRPRRARPRVPARPAVAEPVAVVALGGRFAGAPDAGAFWRTVLSGRDAFAPFDENVLDRDLFHAPGALSLDSSYTDRGAAVRVPATPPAGVRMDPARYAALDAAQRLALTVAAELFGRRSPGEAGLRGRPGMVALGSTLGLGRDRQAHTLASLPRLDAAASELTALKHLSPQESARLLAQVHRRYPEQAALVTPTLFDEALASGSAALIAGQFGLDAVPVAVEAACASSLAALDLAVGALRSGAVDYAVAGGVELPCNERDLVLCSALGLLSHDRITPFDEAADGFTPGDGCALFLLKRLSDARRDGDEVLGVVRGIGGSNDAKSLIAPDADGQVRAMRQAFGQVDFAPADVDYLEAHGTGTKVGDRVEITATGEVYGGPRRSRPLDIGSAKSFFGHTFAAAGGAGLLRALLAMRAGTLPPNANLDRLNPALRLSDIPATVSTRAGVWPRPEGRPRRAGVSSFGTGGINYHLLIEEDLPHSRTDSA
nr:polyketide synthase [Streptomyces sp. PHES57]